MSMYGVGVTAPAADIGGLSTSESDRPSTERRRTRQYGRGQTRARAPCYVPSMVEERRVPSNDGTISPLEASATGVCGCGHEYDVHDAYGCAAWLGAYPQAEPGNVLGHCRCHVGRDGLPGAPIKR
jgi:hypothetical protein